MENRTLWHDRGPTVQWHHATRVGCSPGLRLQSI